MNRIRRAWLLLCVAALLFARAPARAAEDDPAPAFSGSLRALLIGCDHFLSQDDTWPASENSLRLIADILLSDDRHYSLVRSYSSVISSVDAFQAAVENAFQNASAQDISLLYISTHGTFEDGASAAQAGLLLSDGQEEAVLSAQALQRIMDAVPGKKMLILDACNSGAFIGKGLSGGADKVFFSGQDYKVLCSAGGSEASWYYQGGDAAAGASYFASVLSQGLGAQGDHAADQNSDGSITLSEAYAYLLDNYAASTPQVYPQTDSDFILFSYDPDKENPVLKAVTDITFEDTLLTAGQSQVTFSFTVQRQAELYYQVIYHRDGAWQFDQAQHYLDGEQADGTVLPGRKVRTLALQSGKDASGYAIIQLITLEDGVPVFQGARLLCVQPASGDVTLRVLSTPSFLPEEGQELPILVQHSVPCGLTVSIVNESGRAVRYLAYETPTRPQQLSPEASTFCWDGLLSNGTPAPVGTYTVQAKAQIGEKTFTAQSEPFELFTLESILAPSLEQE